MAALYGEVLQAQPTWTDAYVEFPTAPGIFSLWALDAYTAVAGAEAVPEPGTGRVMLEFEVDDVDAEYARLQRLPPPGIQFIIPPTTMAWGNRSIYFRDPEGNLVNLFSQVSSAEFESNAEGRYADR
jgi:catechol 2,3-dioxygenase-like lactoylglutathione lyase family enzyme